MIFFFPSLDTCALIKSWILIFKTSEYKAMLLLNYFKTIYTNMPKVFMPDPLL